jgi:hypothetical protein
VQTRYAPKNNALGQETDLIRINYIMTWSLSLVNFFEKNKVVRFTFKLDDGNLLELDLFVATK